MPIMFHCACGRKLRAEDDQGGFTAKCPACGASISVPQETTPRQPPTLVRSAQPSTTTVYKTTNRPSKSTLLAIAAAIGWVLFFASLAFPLNRASAKRPVLEVSQKFDPPESTREPFLKTDIDQLESSLAKLGFKFEDVEQVKFPGRKAMRPLSLIKITSREKDCVELVSITVAIGAPPEELSMVDSAFDEVVANLLSNSAYRKRALAWKGAASTAMAAQIQAESKLGAELASPTTISTEIGNVRIEFFTSVSVGLMVLQFRPTKDQ